VHVFKNNRVASREVTGMLVNVRRLMGRHVKPAVGVSLVLVVALLGISATRYAEAAPAAQLGPPETTSGTVVAVSTGTFQLERPALTNPATLEQVTIQPPAGVSVAQCDIVSISGRYNIAIKVFIAESLSKLGSACQPAVDIGRAPRPTDIDSSLDNENDDGGDNDND
jgi:hypothetical protein